MGSFETWQPTLEGGLVVARPLREQDFNALFAAASDPAIWAMHPEPDRYTRPQFERYFRSGLASGGALLVRERASGEVIGSSRYCGHDPARSEVEIGYTFLVRRLWSTGANDELKRLMLSHAFQHVERVTFAVGQTNLRSRRAVEKLGATAVRTTERGAPGERRRAVVLYALSKQDWSSRMRR